VCHHRDVHDRVAPRPESPLTNCGIAGAPRHGALPFVMKGNQMNILRLSFLLFLLGYTTVTSRASCAVGEGNNNTLDLYLTKPSGCAVVGYTITVKRGTTGTFTDYDGLPTYSGSPPTWHYQLQVNATAANCGFPRVVQSVLAWTNSSRTLPAGGIQLWTGQSIVDPILGNLTNTCDAGFAPAPPPTNCIVTMSVKNQDFIIHYYSIFKTTDAGTFLLSGVPSPAITVYPGGIGTVTLDDPDCSDGYSLRFSEVDFYGNGQLTNTVVTTNTTVTTNTGVPPTPPTPTNQNPPKPPTGSYDGTNSTGSINFNNSSTNLAKDGTLQAGLTAIYDRLGQGFGVLDADLKMINGNLTNLHPAVSNWISVSNNIVVTNTGTAGTNDMQVVRDFHRDNTNLLGQLANLMTNKYGVPGGVGTNYDSAHSAAVAATTGLTDSIDAMVGASSPPDLGSPGGGVGIDIPLGSYSMHQDIMVGEWGNVWDTFYQVAKWLLTMWYLCRIARDSYDLVFVVASAQQMSLPNLQETFAGNGGNWGAAIGPVLLAGILIAFGIALGWLGVYLTGESVNVLVVTTNPFGGASGAVAVGINYLQRAFPWATLFGLSMAYFTFRLTFIKVSVVMAVVIRAMCGG